MGNDVVITGEDVPEVIITDLNTGDVTIIGEDPGVTITGEDPGVIITGEDQGNVIQAAIDTDAVIITGENRSSNLVTDGPVSHRISDMDSRNRKLDIKKDVKRRLSRKKEQDHLTKAGPSRRHVTSPEDVEIAFDSVMSFIDNWIPIAPQVYLLLIVNLQYENKDWSRT